MIDIYDIANVALCMDHIMSTLGCIWGVYSAGLVRNVKDSYIPSSHFTQENRQERIAYCLYSPLSTDTDAI